MAERRMFHTAVVESDAFLDMPVGVQALYFHLGMQADDDGFLNGPKQIARKLRRPPRELQMLVDKGFLLDFGGVMVIKHWLVANSLKTDRLKPPRYPEIAAKLYINENRCYSTQLLKGTKCLLDVRREKLESKRNPKVREGKVREGKVREDKVSESKVSESKVEEGNPVSGTGLPSAAAAPTYSSMDKNDDFIPLHAATELMEKMGVEDYALYRTKVENFIKEKNAKVIDKSATILKWWQEDRRNGYECEH